MSASASKSSSANVPAAESAGRVVKLLEYVRARAEKAGVFGAVKVDKPALRLVCAAQNSAEPAEYRLDVQQGRLWVSLVTANRWLSQSIEADLVHTGDKIEELIDEELADQDYDLKAAAARGQRTTYEHFRSEDKLFTFRSALPVPPCAMDRADTAECADAAAKWLLAYEACFRRLGDMDAAGEED